MIQCSRSRVIGANMQRKLFVALQLKVGSAGRVEDPAAFGATKTTKTLSFHPYQLPMPTLVVRSIGLNAFTFLEAGTNRTRL